MEFGDNFQSAELLVLNIKRHNDFQYCETETEQPTTAAVINDWELPTFHGKRIAV